MNLDMQALKWGVLVVSKTLFGCLFQELTTRWWK